MVSATFCLGYIWGNFFRAIFQVSRHPSVASSSVSFHWGFVLFCFLSIVSIFHSSSFWYYVKHDIFYSLLFFRLKILDVPILYHVHECSNIWHLLLFFPAYFCVHADFVCGFPTFLNCKLILRYLKVENSEGLGWWYFFQRDFHLLLSLI